jgi:hypothetical protein
VRLSGQGKSASYEKGVTQLRRGRNVTKHDNWRNYERAVEDATDDLAALTRLLENDEDPIDPQFLAPAAAAEYALTDPLCALQEAQTWSQARSALLFWAQRWERAAAFVSLAEPHATRRRADSTRSAGAVARELAYSNHALTFVLSELTSRLVAFREIRPQSAGAAARIAYLEHRHA